MGIGSGRFPVFGRWICRDPGRLTGQNMSDSPRAPLPVLVIVALASISLLAGCSGEQTEVAQPRAVNVVTVNNTKQVSQVAYSGEVLPRYETALGFRLSGKIVARLADVGDEVKASMILARLDPQDQKLNSQAVRSRLAAAQAAYKQATADVDRYTDLYEKKFISRAEYDRRRTQFEVSKAQFEQVQAELSVTENQAQYTQLRAGHAGVITAVEAEVGQVVAAGQTVIRIARTGGREVAISVPENKLADLRTASDIRITLWADPQSAFSGKVREVSPVADPVTRTYAARLSIIDADATVSLGMTANVYLRETELVNSVELPATALFQQGESAAVWVVDGKSSQVRTVVVEVARYFDDKVSVTGGLSEGDVVVRAGVHKLFEGEIVRVLNEAGA
jgi:multidrug efflux system membrane fusion protein